MRWRREREREGKEREVRETVGDGGREPAGTGKHVFYVVVVRINSMVVVLIGTNVVFFFKVFRDHLCLRLCF